MHPPLGPMLDPMRKGWTDIDEDVRAEDKGHHSRFSQSHSSPVEHRWVAQLEQARPTKTWKSKLKPLESASNGADFLFGLSEIVNLIIPVSLVDSMSSSNFTEVVPCRTSSYPGSWQTSYTSAPFPVIPTCPASKFGVDINLSRGWFYQSAE